jgi:predicted protein tyrosine phosphatase
MQRLPGNPADEIIPGIWLGNAIASQDQNFFNERRIEAVFNCTKDLPFLPNIPRKYRLPVHDNLQDEEIRAMELASFEVIYKLSHEHKKGPVLVHCAAGMQRSAAVVAMYLIAKTPGLRVEDAILFIQKKRPIAFTPGPNFLRAIKAFETAFDREVRPKLK